MKNKLYIALFVYTSTSLVYAMGPIQQQEFPIIINDEQVSKYNQEGKKLTADVNQLQKIRYSPELDDKITEIVETVKERLVWLGEFTVKAKDFLPQDKYEDIEKNLLFVNAIFRKEYNRLILEKKSQMALAYAQAHTCSGCSKLTKHIKQCTRCKNRKYCSINCLRDDWQKHKNECDQYIQDHTCCVCTKVVKKINQCSQCKKRKYCSRSCQVQDWPSHKKACLKITIEQ